MLRRTALIAVAAASLCLTACGSSTSASSPSTSAAAPSSAAVAASPAGGPAASGSQASADAITEWCNAYSVITTVLSQGTAGKGQAEKAILGLDRYADLWKAAGEGELLTPDEVNANLRAIAAYRPVLNAIAAGKSETSDEVKAAKEHILSVTEADHDILQSSAGKVLGYCGAPTASPSAPSGPTPSGS